MSQLKFVPAGMQAAGTGGGAPVSRDAPGTLILSAYGFRRFLFLCIGFLTLLEAIHIFCQYQLNLEGRWLQHLRYYFGFRTERNVPSLFSGLLLFVATVLLLWISRTKTDGRSNHRFYWGLMSVVFLYLCADETFSFHEQLIGPVRSRLDNDMGGLLHYSWVVPYGAALVIGLLFFFQFFRRLPRIVRARFLLAAFLFVSGALGLELLQGYFYTRGYFLGDQLLGSVEELMEMVGTTIFIHALMCFLAPETGLLRLAPVQEEPGRETTRSRKSVAVTDFLSH